MNLTNIVIVGAFATQGCSLDTKVSDASTPNTETPVKTEVSSTPSHNDAKDYAEYDTSKLGTLGFVRIGNDRVSFNHDDYFGGNRNRLTVLKNVYSSALVWTAVPNITYYDNNGNDLKIELVVIEKDDLRYIYDDSVPEDQPYIADAQKQFDTYLPKILVVKEELRQSALTKKKEVGQELLREGKK